MRASLSALLADAELTSGEQQRCAAVGRGETSEFWSDARPGDVSAETVLDVLRLVADYLDTMERMLSLD